MVGNAIIRVKNVSEKEAWALAYYAYRLCTIVDGLGCHEEFQLLYNSLVEKLGLRKHSQTIIDEFINRLVKKKKLTPMTDEKNCYHPFEKHGQLQINYMEDEHVYDMCGNWNTKTLNDINLVRVIFADSNSLFINIIALTFFVTPEEFEKNKNIRLSAIEIPVKVKKAVEDISDIKFAADSLKLDKNESELLQLSARLHGIVEMYNVCNDLFRTDISRVEIYAACLKKSVKDIRALLRKERKLKAYGLIKEDGDMEQDAMDAIYDGDMQTYFTDIINQEKNTGTFRLSTFDVKKQETDIAVQFLKNKKGCNILLYGAPGSGKTEYAKALIKASGLKMMVYRNELETDEANLGDKALRRLNCYLSIKKDDSVLIVDEAETVLQTSWKSFFGAESSHQKGTVNKMLEQSENKVIWIVNYTGAMDISTLRRFTFSIHFNEMPKSTLRAITENKLKRIKLKKELKKDILNMCESYRVTGASVENIVKAIDSLDFEKCSDEIIRQEVKAVLEANSSLLFGKKKIRSTVNKSYDLSVLNSTVKATKIVDMLKVAEQKNAASEEKNGIRMLFYGLSGTGKTELARYISETLHKPLLLKRVSDIMSMWVGETEKNIRRAFEEAEESDSILLLDEADSFFADRTNARNSWEITQVNEFLTQMEEFSGILICTTNLRKIMDPAMQRRFNIISEFKALDESGIKKLLCKFFANYKYDEKLLSRLIDYNTVTPGDFGSLNGRIRFIPDEDISGDYILNELIQIQEEKKHNGDGRIGFAS